MAQQLRHESHELQGVAQALFTHQGELIPKDRAVSRLGMGLQAQVSAGRHQPVGLLKVLHAHQHLAVGPEVGLALGGGQRQLLGQVAMDLQGRIELVEIAQTARQPPLADGAVGLEMQGPAVTAVGRLGKIGKPERIGLVGQKTVIGW